MTVSQRFDSSAFGLPMFWPIAAASALLEAGADAATKNLSFLSEESKIAEIRPIAFATEARERLNLRTLRLREYGQPVKHQAPTLICAPYAGHSAAIADYADGQSLVQTLLGNEIGHVLLTDWKSATGDMKDLEVDQYLAEIHVCIDDLGGRVNLVGLCQGGWMSAMYAARFPGRVASLVLAGAPIDASAGDGPVKKMAHAYPLSLYKELVAAGEGLMLGRFMLAGWKGMHPDEQYIDKHIDLFEHIGDPAYIKKTELFESWYENPIDLPGRWYLQVIEAIFKENQLALGKFVALGRAVHLKDITCPAYLLAGAADDITPKAQVFAARALPGAAKAEIVNRVAPGGHIGLFMGGANLRSIWPDIARWISATAAPGA